MDFDPRAGLEDSDEEEPARVGNVSGVSSAFGTAASVKIPVGLAVSSSSGVGIGGIGSVTGDKAQKRAIPTATGASAMVTPSLAMAKAAHSRQASQASPGIGDWTRAEEIAVMQHYNLETLFPSEWSDGGGNAMGGEGATEAGLRRGASAQRLFVPGDEARVQSAIIEIADDLQDDEDPLKLIKKSDYG